jgi:hypothetical protein
MGRIVAKDKMPSCKFQFPRNGEIIQAGQVFTIKMAVQNFEVRILPDFCDSMIQYLHYTTDWILRQPDDELLRRPPNR